MIGKYDITAVKARQVLDSRGHPTVECDLYCGKGFGRASVPSGASKGSHEAVELRDGYKDYQGQGVLKAVENVVLIGQKLIGEDVRDQGGIDRISKDLDGTKDKSHLGSNAVLAVSLAANRAAASAKEVMVYEHIGQIYTHEEPEYWTPVPFFNVINGGAHSGSTLDIQEFMIVPRAKTFSDALRIGSETYYELKAILEKKYGKAATNVGDEGGFAPPMKSTEEALDALVDAAKKAGHSKEVFLALDCAANHFFAKGKYKLDKKALPAGKLIDYYEKLCKDYPIVSIEDPFHEEDYSSFTKLTKAIGDKVQIVGDDIFASNESRVREGIRNQAANCVLLKVNQVGTLTDAFLTAQLAQHSNYGVMVSHRSGETVDDFIADLSVGIECRQIKAGAPCRGERVAKYNELLRIEEMGVPHAEWFR
jgi:enolase